MVLFQLSGQTSPLKTHSTPSTANARKRDYLVFGRDKNEFHASNFYTCYS